MCSTEDKPARSFKPEFQTDDTGRWYTNSTRFATQAEAHQAAYSIAMRWAAVRDYRAAPSNDPVNYKIVDNALQEVH